MTRKQLLSLLMVIQFLISKLSFNLGRLLQVEYAIEAINKAGSSIGILTKEGIVLATVREDVSSLLEQSIKKNNNKKSKYIIYKQLFF